MATKYMNRFAIEEDDQFEIHVKDYKDSIRGKEMYNAAEEVILKAYQGSGENYSESNSFYSTLYELK